MKTTKWFGGAVVLSVALSLAMAGGAWAQSKGREYGSDSGGYGTGSSGGYGYEKDKKQTGSQKSEEQSASGVCTPKSCGPQKSKGATDTATQPQTSK